MQKNSTLVTKASCLGARQARKRSQTIDQMLEDDARVRIQQWKVLPLGSLSMKETVKGIKGNNEIGLTKDELISYRHNIHQRVFECIREMVQAIITHNICLNPDENRESFSYLEAHVANADPNALLDEDIGTAVESLWKEISTIETLKSHDECGIGESTRYFLDEIVRISTPQYLPTEKDVLTSRNAYHGVLEHILEWNGARMSIVDVGIQSCERRKWFHLFEDIDAVLYTVDLSQYDQEGDTSRLSFDIEIFTSVVNSKWLTKTAVVLLLWNVSLFRRKLAHDPLRNYMPEFSGAAHPDASVEWVVDQFSGVSDKSIYVHLADPNDPSTIPFLFAAFNDWMQTRQGRY
ncbi:G-alpha-domain-containing protein [Periconia macrospinosa]|uniref:G-alpha-domain-containing protein n=1 Tax=Periconia macrospinosa TaxID=97972 RepID=A0A2V1DY56_9PLEO|nr:G-alpha-domain-containing protein [Periconia macrospinosa]